MSTWASSYSPGRRYARVQSSGVQQRQTTGVERQRRVLGGWHSQVQQLAPYIDANGDEQVSHEEFTAFVRNFGGVDDSQETLKKAIQVTAASYHRNPLPPPAVHCLRPLQRRSIVLGVSSYAPHPPPSAARERTVDSQRLAAYCCA